MTRLFDSSFILHPSPSFPLRVLFVTTTYPLRRGDVVPGFVEDLARHLVREQNISVGVIAPHHDRVPKHEVIDGVCIDRFQYSLDPNRQCFAYGGGIPDNLKTFPRAKWQAPAFFAAMGRAIYQAIDQCDVIHAHWVEPGFIATLANFAHRKPLVITVHSLRPRPGLAGKSLSRFALSRADRVLFNSRYTQNEAARLGYRCRGQVVYQGYDAEMFEKRSDRLEGDRQADRLEACPTAWRQRLGIEPQTKLLIAVGRMIPVKGLEVLASAADRILRDRPQWHLVIAGDGPRRAAIERELSSALSRSRVHLTGALPRKELASLLTEGDLFVNPGIVDADGRAEGLGLTTIEAMAAALPAVASRCGGISETIVDGVTGLLTPPGDRTALAANLARLMSDEAMRWQMGQAAAAYVREKFTWPLLAGQVAEVYRQVTA